MEKLHIFVVQMVPMEFLMDPCLTIGPRKMIIKAYRSFKKLRTLIFCIKYLLVLKVKAKGIRCDNIMPAKGNQENILLSHPAKFH